MSMIAAVLAGQAAAAAARPTVETRYVALTAVSVRCATPTDGRELVVCGRRQADRWRVPLIEPTPGDPRAEGVSAERNRLASEPPPSCGTRSTFIGCGKLVGIGVSVGGGGNDVTFRTPAD